MSFGNDLRRMMRPTGVGGQLALLAVLGTIFAAAVPSLGANLVLIPRMVTDELKLWQLVSWVAVFQFSPLSVIFGVLIIISTASYLEDVWGRRRLWLFIAKLMMTTAVLTVLSGLLTVRVGGNSFEGASVLAGALWVAQGVVVGPGQMNFWGAARISGYVYALIGAAFTILNGLFVSFFAVVPSLYAIGIVVLLVKGYGPGDLWTRFRGWQLERDLKRRSAKLRVVAGEKRNMPGDSDRYLH